MDETKEEAWGPLQQQKQEGKLLWAWDSDLRWVNI